MTCFLPDPAPTSATHKGAALSEQAAASYDHVIVMLPASAAGDDTWPAFAHSDHLRRLLLRLREPSDSTVVTAVLPDAQATAVSVGFCKPDADTFSLLASARRAVAEALRQRLIRVAVLAPGFEPERQALVLRCVVGALAAGAAPMPKRKRVSGESAATAAQALEQIDTFGDCTPGDYTRELAEAEGNALARWLSALPSNELTVAGYLDRIRSLADTFDWEITVLGEEQLTDAGAKAFLAVAQGSLGKPESAPALVRLRYRPDGGHGKTAADVALVGKGICFDTGGVNVKPVQYMQTMNEDMQGSAVAIGTLLAISRLRLPLAVDAWLALAENTIGPSAYKPQDVITAANGTTIEIVHTDAEGRMVLADTLHLAAKETPGLMVDLATLTGACVNALTTAFSGVFTNRPALHPQLIAAGSDSGERVWPFPLHEDFDQALESDIADIKQCAVDGRGDHILAARFLQRFVPDQVPWVHVDLAASRHKGGLAHVPTDITGFGVRFLMNLLLDQMGIARAADEGPNRQ